ncbi:MAG: hypothetical protein ABI678_26090 [Kofleriaceae bacterium]
MDFVPARYTCSHHDDVSFWGMDDPTALAVELHGRALRIGEGAL